MIPQYELNDLIIQIYKSSKMNQKQFAKEYDINYSSLNHILTKENVCSFNLFRQILNKMNLKLKIEVYGKNETT